MKLQLDTQAKTVKFEESVKLGKLFDIIQQILPNDEWKEFTLVPHSITSWVNPIIYPWGEYPWVKPATPWYNGIPDITCYNIEVK